MFRVDNGALLPLLEAPFFVGEVVETNSWAFSWTSIFEDKGTLSVGCCCTTSICSPFLVATTHLAPMASSLAFIFRICTAYGQGQG
jgi:hypothetical protein